MNNLNEIQLLPNRSVIKNLQLWLSFRNDFITPDKFTEYYGLHKGDAGRFLHSMRAVIRKHDDKSLLQIFGLVTDSGKLNVLPHIPLFNMTNTENCKVWGVFDGLMSPRYHIDKTVDAYLKGWCLERNGLSDEELAVIKEQVMIFLECMSIIKAILPNATPHEIFQIKGE